MGDDIAELPRGSESLLASLPCCRHFGSRGLSFCYYSKPAWPMKKDLKKDPFCFHDDK